MTIIEFPSDKPSPVPSGDIAARTAANSSAFLRLESPIRDAALMAEIVMGLIMEAHEDDDLEEHTAWAAVRLCEMVESLRDQYRTRDRGDI
jgi:hypothetical protein